MTSIGDGEVTFELQGSRDETTWRTIDSLVSNSGISLSTMVESENVDLFVSKYEYVRLVVTTSVSVTFTAFVVDATLDMLVMYKMLHLGCLPYAGNPEADEMILNAKSMYSSTLQSLSIDTDIDGDMAIESGEENTQPIAIGYR